MTYRKEVMGRALKFATVFFCMCYFLGAGVWSAYTFLNCPPCNCPGQVCNLTCPEPVCNMECPELPLFMREAHNVAEAHDWESMRYMCCDFSIELFERLQADGYADVMICEGTFLECDQETSDSGCSHCWVKIGASIAIETVTGTVIPPKDYEKKYEEKRCYYYVRSGLRDWTSSYGSEALKDCLGK